MGLSFIITRRVDLFAGKVNGWRRDRLIQIMAPAQGVD